MATVQSKQRFEELLPWFVNGTLARQDQEWMEAYLRDHPEAGTELRLTQALRTRIQDGTPTIAPDLGMDRLMHRIRSEQAMTRQAVRAPGLLERIGEFFGGFKFTPAFAGAAALVVVQGAVIGGLMMRLDDATESVKQAEYRALNVQPGAAASTPLLRISFKPGTTEEKVRELLGSLGGSFVGGPTAFGDYLILVDPGKIEQLSAKAAEQAIVANVSIVRNGAPQ